MRKSVVTLCLSFVMVLPTMSLSQIWVARYNGPGNGWDGGNAIAIDDVGNIYVAGSSNGVGSLYDYATIKYSPSGVEQWVARYNGPGNGSDEANAIAVDHAGNVYVTGHSEGGPGTGADYATIKYDSSGAQQWVARYNGPGNMADGAGGIVLDNAGNVYVTGFSVGAGTESDYALVKYDSSGVEQWVARYNGPDNSYDGSIAIVLDHAGNVYITGTSRGSATDDDYVTLKYGSSGVEQWAARYNGPANGRDGARAMAIDSSGNVYVTGSSQGLGTDNDYATVKYNSFGVEQWVVRYNGPANHWDDASAIAVDHVDNIYVTGRSVDADLEDDYATIKYSSSGVEQWVARYDGPANSYDDSRALTIDNGANVYVTGYSVGLGSGDDYTSVKYNSSGEEQWVERYNGPANGCDDALAIAVDNRGYVYVTGWSRGPGSGFDYATLKYSCTGVEEDLGYEISDMRCDLTVYPNPFRNETDIRYRMCDNSQKIFLKIYDASGRLVRQFDHKTIGLSDYITWDGCDDQCKRLPSGVYFLRFAANPVGTSGSGGEAADYKETKKLILVR